MSLELRDDSSKEKVKREKCQNTLNDFDDEFFKYVALKCNTSSHQYFLSDQYNCQNIDTVVINTVAFTLHQMFMYFAMDLKYNYCMTVICLYNCTLRRAMVVVVSSVL